MTCVQRISLLAIVNLQKLRRLWCHLLPRAAGPQQYNLGQVVVHASEFLLHCCLSTARHTSLVLGSVSSFLTCSGRAVPVLDSLAPDDRLGLIMGRKSRRANASYKRRAEMSSLSLSMMQR